MPAIDAKTAGEESLADFLRCTGISAERAAAMAADAYRPLDHRAPLDLDDWKEVRDVRCDRKEVRP